MIKNRFYSLDKAEKEALFYAISNITRMPAFAVEKDWWVVQTLAIIFEMEIGSHLVFKGGTSLSKAWGLIERFSEDIDLAIDRKFLGFEGNLSKNQRTALRKSAYTYISTKFIVDLKQKFTEKGFSDVTFNLIETSDSDQDPSIIEIYYPNIIQSLGYIQPRVQLEIGCRSLREPFSFQSFTSVIDKHYPDLNFAQLPIVVPTVNPERTFLEKIFLLHEEFQKPIDKVRINRLSRHLYDVFHLSKTHYATNALTDKALYETIVIHRYNYTRIGGVDYNLHQPQSINPIPIPEILEAWNVDYNTMVEQMIYEQNPPKFNELISNLTNLKNKINSIEWKFETQFPTSLQVPK